MVEMLPYYWPCRIERTRDGLFRIMPDQLPDCDGIGPTLDVAKKETLKRIQERLAEIQTEDFPILPLQALDVRDIVSGRAVRLEVLADTSISRILVKCPECGAENRINTFQPIDGRLSVACSACKHSMGSWGDLNARQAAGGNPDAF